MNLRKPLVATAVALSVFVPAGNVLATSDATAAESDNTSTTVPARREAAKSFRAEVRAWQTATREWVGKRAAVRKAHRETMASASAALKDSLSAASTKEQRKAAMQTFAAASKSAKSQLNAALAAIGERPERPRR